MTMPSLSILIPTFNGICTKLVTDLHEQAEQIGMDYEIIVADDGSTDQDTIRTNRNINELSHSRYMEQQQNVGRAAVRNFLAQQAQYDWLLFIDSDMIVCRQNYLQQYIRHTTPNVNSSTQNAIIYGGVTIGNLVSGNLRSIYEKSVEHEHTVEKRQQSPYHDFHTANFLIKRDIMLQHLFDERFHHYGYEDVMFGKQLQQYGIAIIHIDNPLSFEVFESNDDFVSKTEEGLRTLFHFRHELQGYSRLLSTLHTPLSPLLCPLLRLWHRMFGGIERRHLTGNHPSLFIFKLYKLGYFLTLHTPITGIS